MPRHVLLTTNTHELKVLPWLMSCAEIKTTSSFRDSGRVNSRFKVSDLRDPEMKQKSEHTCKNGSVLNVEKTFLFGRQDFKVLRSRKEKENQLWISSFKN